ncbi:MAG: CRP/FNR family cyclic AMP-dependent transcriptional regulator [Candidatus Endobugula sp.]|jgi:CRP/FNR family cyclic AMP-dependent transcriptional regulator
MNIREISTISPEALHTLLSAIPFYKAVKQQDEAQFATLMRFSRIIQYDSGEKVLSRGDLDTWTYFIVKGQLVVLAPDSRGLNHQVNYITPGEVLGDLSVYLQSARTADVYVDNNCREAILFGTDIGLFGDLVDFSNISLATKLLYYRHATHTLRWKLEMYRSKYRTHPLADKHRAIKLYTGIKDSELELKPLYNQAVDLAMLLVKWNESFGSLSFSDGTVPSPDLKI